MLSSSDNKLESQAADLGESVDSANTKPNLLVQMDTELVFRLIDSILPFEACLYHQVVPLSLEGSRLKLGMVNLEDTEAFDYVRRILAYMNCSLVPHTITSETHHAILSAYLNYAGKREQKKGSRSVSDVKSIDKSGADPAAEVETLTERISRSSASVALEKYGESSTEKPPQIHSNRNNEVIPTLLVDAPQKLTESENHLVAHQLHQQANPPLKPSQTEPTLVLDPEATPSSEALPEIPTPGEALPLLEINAKHLSDPIDVLEALPASELLQELLGRVLEGGIGRLYFERQQDQGRILWSQDGVLKSVLEALPVATLQGVISELKRLTRLPDVTIEKPQQVEIERLYQRQRLLLRLRVMPGEHGEEATLQVLRGAALKFYQQQQLARLSRDALSIAQELQRKMNELRVRTRFYALAPEPSTILPALGEVIKSVEQQLEFLRMMQAQGFSEEEK
jgi:type II secretory ATPase GspE/PulE/Tfp pilus assembly ATPase PilB-like protein